MSDPRAEHLALVMEGGGARAAYQVGFVRHLARRFPDLEIPIITGVSAGAINAVHLASREGSFHESTEELVSLWANLTTHDVFRVDSRSLLMNVLRWGGQLISGGFSERGSVRGLVDTEPLRQFLHGALRTGGGEIRGIRRNLEEGRLKAIALSTSSYTTGQSITWVQGRGIDEWERPRRRSQETVLTVEHVMASAALPLFFPAVQLDGAWYGDGGIRLSAPLSPAIHLGARRILAISTRYEASFEEASLPEVVGYPPPAQVLGVLLNSIFLDQLDQDAFRVDRINELLRRLPEDQREGLRPIQLMTLRPSVDLGRLANEFEPQLPSSFRFLTRGLGTRATDSPDVLSLLLFQPDYLQRLIDVGEADAEARSDEIERFVNGSGDGPA